MMIRPYGDTLNDGAVQMSFTLPVAHSAKADEAAIIFGKKLGFKEVEVVHSNPLSDEFTFFVVYGKTEISIDYDKVVVEEVEKSLDFYGVNNFIKENIKRKCKRNLNSLTAESYNFMTKSQCICVWTWSFKKLCSG